MPILAYSVNSPDLLEEWQRAALISKEQRSQKRPEANECFATVEIRAQGANMRRG